MKYGTVDYIPRNDKFLQRITDATCRQILSMGEHSRERRAKTGFLSLCTLLVGGMIWLGFNRPDWLLFYTLAVLVLSLGILIVYPWPIHAFEKISHRRLTAT